MSADAGPDRPAPQSNGPANHTTVDVRSLAADLLRWEDSKPFMYADTRGFVTTGIGNKLGRVEDAIALPWRHAKTGAPATPSEVRQAFEKVLARYEHFQSGNTDGKKSAAAGYYEHSTDLVLPDGCATDLATSRLEKDFLPGLRQLFPGFDGYPQPAQRALVDMVYTLGKEGLEHKFPTVVEACRTGRFADAASHCHRKAHANEHRKSDERNDATKRQFLEAANLNAALQTLPREVRL